MAFQFGPLVAVAGAAAPLLGGWFYGVSWALLLQTPECQKQSQALNGLQ